MIFENFLESVQSPRLKAIILKWDEARGSNRLPSFEQLQPSQVPDQAKRMWVYRYDAATGRFTGQLSGDQITKSLGKNLRGLPLEETYSAETYLWIHRVLTRVVTEPAMYRSTGNLFKQGGRLIAGERVALPLSTNGSRGDGVMGISDYRDPHLAGPYELLNENEAWVSLGVS